MSTTKSLLLLLANCIYFTIAQNCTALRNYTVGIKVSSIWYSGTSDNIFLTICNDGIDTNTSTTCNSNCLKWYEIEGGMPNRGEWYTFEYIDQPDIGNPNRIKLVTYDNDQLCIERVEIDDERWKKDSDTTSFSCIEMAEGNPDGSCDVLNITLRTDSTVANQPADFASETYDSQANACINNGINTTNKIVIPPKPLENGTRLYTMLLEVSSVPWSGTSNNLYVRLCNTINPSTETCTQLCLDYMDDTTCIPEWFEFDGGANEEGNTYPAYWVTKDIGDIVYAQIATFGSDEFCLGKFTVSSDNPSSLTEVTVDSPSYERDCIEDDTQDGCDWLNINFNSGDIDTPGGAGNCLLEGLADNSTTVFVTKYKFTFKLSDLPFCGYDAVSYFIFCSPDGSPSNNGSCSRIYEVGAKMPETGDSYSYTIDISDYPMFNTLLDIKFLDIYSYTSEFWCLSQFYVDGITEDGTEVDGYALDFSVSIDADLSVEGERWCGGIRIEPQAAEADDWEDGPAKTNSIKTCRWNAVRDQYGTVAVSESSSSQDFFDWINDGYNWVYLCVALIGLVICCICGCAILQHIKKKKEAQLDAANADESGHYGKDTNRPWHGGNSAFYG